MLFPNMLDIIYWDETMQSVYKVTKDQASKVSDLWWIPLISNDQTSLLINQIRKDITYKYVNPKYFSDHSLIGIRVRMIWTKL